MKKIVLSLVSCALAFNLANAKEVGIKDTGIELAYGGEKFRYEEISTNPYIVNPSSTFFKVVETNVLIFNKYVEKDNINISNYGIDTAVYLGNTAFSYSLPYMENTTKNYISSPVYAGIGIHKNSYKDKNINDTINEVMPVAIFKQEFGFSRNLEYSKFLDYKVYLGDAQNLGVNSEITLLTFKTETTKSNIGLRYDFDKINDKSFGSTSLTFKMSF